MIHRDLFEQLAIERRRNAEEERKKRIFDPKMRIKGVDFAAIPEQIKEKEERKTAEQEREMLFAKQCQEINMLLERISVEMKKRRFEEAQRLNEFRKQQKSDDPLVPRVPIDTANPHVSNCQSFVGDDVERTERLKKQHEQMKVWVQEQVWQREEAKRKQQEEERNFKQYQDELIRSLDEIERKRQELLKERDRRDVEYNMRLAAYKHIEDQKDKEDRTFGHVKLMNESKLGALIYEQPIMYRNDGRVIVAEYKGMTEHELQTIRGYQDMQKQVKEEKLRMQKQEEEEYAAYEKQVIFMQNLLDAKKAEILKEQMRLQNEVNDLLKEQFKKRYQKVIDYELQPFFSTFNTSSR